MTHDVGFKIFVVIDLWIDIRNLTSLSLTVIDRMALSLNIKYLPKGRHMTLARVV